MPHLMRAVLLDGRYDHALTGAALLAQAGVAQRANNSKAAAMLYREASVAAFGFGDFDVVSEALSRGHINHVAGGAPGAYPPLPLARAWADRRNLDHIEWVTRHAMVEGLANSGEIDQAAKLLTAGGNRQRDLTAGRLGIDRDWLAARLMLLQGDQKDGLEALAQALQRKAMVSLTNFQTGLANLRFDNGALSARLAVDAYSRLLSDPSSQAWLLDPANVLANLKTDQDAALDRWFAASLARRELMRAIDVSDIAKRRRFFRSLPLAGRLVAMRQLLESPIASLNKAERLERQALLSQWPRYEQLAATSQEMLEKARGADELIVEGRLSPDISRLFTTWGRTAAEQEMLLLNAALSRTPTTLGFPPFRPAVETQKLLGEGDALLVFHRSAGALHGFLLVPDGEHAWRLPDVRPVTAAVSTGLRDIGHYTRTRALPVQEAESDEWRSVARKLGRLLLGDSRLDPKALKRLVVVPDGPLWHVPFEMLLLTDGPGGKPLVGEAPIRYSPTVSLAYGDTRPLRPLRKSGLVASRPTGSDIEREVAEDTRERLAVALGEPLRFATPSPAPSPLLAAAVERLVVESEIELSPQAMEDWAPTPIDRTRARGSLKAWMALPAASPEWLVLGGTRTAAESALKAGRRSAAASDATPGDELFHAACGLLASGPRTVLVSRWSTGGALHGELLREFVSQLDKRPASEAWRRSVMLARESALDPVHEPRLAWSERDGSPPLAGHPFFWSGYLLLDTGTDPRPPAEGDEAEEKAAAAPAAEAKNDEPAAAQ